MRILVEDIWAEDLFKWFSEHIHASCGDGCGLIVSKNYKEVADWFEEWYNQEHKFPLLLHRIKEEGNNYINFHDSNENFIFSNEESFMFRGDYTFIVKKDCIFAFNSDKEILCV